MIYANPNIREKPLRTTILLYSNDIEKIEELKKILNLKTRSDVIRYAISRIYDIETNR